MNDGSKDNTLAVLRQLYREHPERSVIFLSRNFGKEAGLYAGLKATGDLVTVMDVDLQDPPELLPQMIEMIETSTDLDCVGTRITKTANRPFVAFARMFYKLINRIAETEMVDGARDFRVMTRQMVDAILELSEYNRFSKGF